MVQIRMFSKIVVRSLNEKCIIFGKENINKNRIFYHVKKRQSFPFSNHLHQKVLFKAAPCLHTSFKRNMSSNSVPTEKNLESSTEDITYTQIFEHLKITFADILDDVSQGPLSQWSEQLLLQVHEISGLSWWASIAFTTFLVRTSIILPFSLKQVQTLGKLDVISFKMKEVDIKLKDEIQVACKQYGWPKDFAEKKFRETSTNTWKNYVKKEKCHPTGTLLPIIIQIPTWLAFTTAINKLCKVPQNVEVDHGVYEELMVGGFGWVINLTEVDQSMILPFSLCLINLAIIQVHSLFKMKEYKFSLWVFRFTAIIQAVIASYFPAGVNVYCLSSSLYALFLPFILNSRPVLAILDVPVKGTNLEYPFRLFYSNIKSRFRLTSK